MLVTDLYIRYGNLSALENEYNALAAEWFKLLLNVL